MNEPRKILVIQLRRIGDVLLTTPAVAALKKRYPRAAIDFLVEPAGAQVLARNPNIENVHVYDAKNLSEALAWIRRVRALRYDWLIDYMGNPRSALITASSGAAVKAGPAHVFHRWAYNHPLTQSSTTHYAGLEKIRVLKSLGVPSEGQDFLPSVHFSAPVSAQNRVGLVPASRRATRRWPAASYVALGRLLKRRYGCEITVFWGPGEKALAEEVASGVGHGASVSEETGDMESLAKLMAACRLIVANCNGPKHLAVALGVPTITIFGSSDPTSWNPPHPRHLAARLDDLFCIGCGLNRCPYGLECMTGLKPERVLDLAARLLEEPARR